ncbi:MAG: FAD-dependent oxidoreductase, partial [Gammaproteobacteria bacterium]|nr:FAD-dependent oxidoreductase [Gammaproteobacteria bacterium]
MRIAIIGGGIAGLYTAHRLFSRAELTVFEAGSTAGGHSNTVEVAMDGQRLAIDTGFIVFNERNYPLFTALLRELGVAWQASDMSFGFRCAHTGLEYRGDNNFDA